MQKVILEVEDEPDAPVLDMAVHVQLDVHDQCVPAARSDHVPCLRAPPARPLLMRGRPAQR